MLHNSSNHAKQHLPPVYKLLPSDRSFGLLFTLVLGGLGVYTQYKGGLHFGAMAFYATSSLLLLISFLVPRLLTPFNKAWFWLGQTLGKIVSPFILGIIFFLLITPIALLGKLFGRDELRLKKRHISSYWIERKPVDSAPESFKYQF